MMGARQEKAIMFLTLLMLLVWAGPGAAQEQEAAAVGADGDESGLVKYREPTYIYSSIGMRDPFRSLIQKVELSDEGDMERPRTPLESYNVSQLNLIAIVSAGDKAYALVVLPDGKSYTVHEGMNIGLHDGIVKEIRSDQVVVEVETKDHKGNKKLEEVFLKLRQEDDK
ncbi:MAG: pilus assembly protein PilP [Thermodesulfovibrionales bacterium]|nr:pilus assembly protein PilP [Thermodesulfovibrionales bacterium]